MAGQGLLLAAVLLVLVAQPSEAQLIGRLAARITNRLDASPVAAPNVTTCPVSPASTQLNFTNLVSACPATSALNTTDFCDGCICALTDAYMPALRAAGVFNITEANASATDSSMLAAATAVVRACSATFLAPALAAGVELGGLTRLSTQCNFTAASVPECLRQKLAALQPAAIPQVTSSDLRSTASGGDYVEDNSTALTNDVLQAAAAATPVTSTGAGSNATVVPTQAGNATTIPADNSTLVTVSPNATIPAGNGTAALPDGTIADPTLTAPLNTTTTTNASTTPVASVPVATVPAATTATTPSATTPDGSAAAFPDYTPVASPDAAAAATPDAPMPAATPPAATPPVAPPVVVNPPAVVPDAAPQTVTVASTVPAPVTSSDAPNGATLQQLPVQLIGALLSASLLVLLL